MIVVCICSIFSKGCIWLRLSQGWNSWVIPQIVGHFLTIILDHIWCDNQTDYFLKTYSSYITLVRCSVISLYNLVSTSYLERVIGFTFDPTSRLYFSRIITIQNDLVVCCSVVSLYNVGSKNSERVLVCRIDPPC